MPVYCIIFYNNNNNTVLYILKFLHSLKKWIYERQNNEFLSSTRDHYFGKCLDAHNNKKVRHFSLTNLYAVLFSTKTLYSSSSWI